MCTERVEAAATWCCSWVVYSGAGSAAGAGAGAVRMGGKWRWSRRSKAPRGGDPASAAPSSAARSESVAHASAITGRTPHSAPYIQVTIVDTVRFELYVLTGRAAASVGLRRYSNFADTEY